MPFTDLPKEEKTNLATTLNQLNELLRSQNLKLQVRADYGEVFICLESLNYGPLGSLEDNGYNLHLVDEETYVEYLSSED
jgi:hypothetical protein